MMLLAMFVPLIVLGLILLTTAFWIWMLVDCATNQTLEGNGKVVWIIVVVFTHWIGALIYFFVKRPQKFRGAPRGAGSGR
jgi:hypothetical protein